MNLNPLALIDSILSDYASPKARRALHSLLLLGAVLTTVWLTAEGNWQEAVIALIAAVYAGANQANTPAIPVESDEEDEDDGLTYGEAGGLAYDDEPFESLATFEPSEGENYPESP